MIFQSGASIDGPYEFGYEPGWHWSRNGGSYDRGGRFFWVHWEISDRHPGRVKLHVECPPSAVEPELNAIKQRMVLDFLSPHFRNILEASGYVYTPGQRIKVPHIQNNKSTQPFRIQLADNQIEESHRQNIETVNAVAGDLISAIVKEYSEELSRYVEPQAE